MTASEPGATARRTAGCLAVLALLLVPLVDAHGTAPPASRYTRLLADCVDDWFGEDAGASSTGYDLHSLDVREAYGDDGPFLAFKLILNGNGPANVTFAMTAAGALHEVRAATDGTTWSPGDAPRLLGPGPAMGEDGQTQDGQRFWIEAIVPYAAWGLSEGDRLDDFAIRSTANGTEGDGIPGLHGAAGTCNSADGAPYDRGALGSYPLRGTGYYVELDLKDATVPAGSDAVLHLDLKNRLRDGPQEVTVQVDGAQVQGGGRFTLAPSQTRTVDLAVPGGAAGDVGTFTITVTTDQGGRLVETFDYTVVGAGDAHDSPMAFGLVLIALFAVAWSRR